MRKSIVAGAALLAGFAIVAPDLGWSADDVAQVGQSETVGQGMPGMEHGMMGGPGGERDDMGNLRRFRDMREQMMPGMMPGMMHGMMHSSPQRRCEERVAQQAAMIAYTATKLKLTAEQKPLWDKLDATLTAARVKEQQRCDALMPRSERERASVLDRLDRAEQRLSARLDTLHQVRPALQQLYQGLTPEQKATIDQSFRRG